MERPFVEVQHVLWDANQGGPLPGQVTRDASHLRGEHEWTFSLNLPSTAAMSFKNHPHAMSVFGKSKDDGRDAVHEYRLPPTWSGHATFKWAIRYELKVAVERSMFRSDDT